MSDLPGPGLEPVFPALAGEFLTTAPPGKPPIEEFLPNKNKNETKKPQVVGTSKDYY